ncbi:MULTISPECIES: flagellar hook capping FlgD N-terminal domain-containing protein [unclassified Legionella]|uniref:flagellar hook capping FlgD N-terminal domain-containing protein n=1 Tax=unclassified Legionella TaxID=2622702 RepID=UPI0010545869|nr:MULTISPECIES: flagellar hook capping FlgD N-terminal domain-containing protein [unclassified Legionella]MDI9817550.1 flagellar hook capping FlgD N-terminal domain-containing protein [Legionella sp. PL877]
MTDSIEPTQASGVNQADYLKLFMQELTYQDPLKPVDNREFMAQMAQFSNLQIMQTMHDTLTLLTSMTSGNQSLMLLGRRVKIKNSDEEGLVNKIEFPDKAPPKIHVTMNGGTNQVQLTEITAVLN